MRRIDGILLTTVILLVFFGLFMIYDASSYIAFRDFGDKYHYFKEQIVWIILGFLSLIFFSVFNYQKLRSIALPILITSIILLILVFVPGLGINALGATRWISFAGFSLQPTEFAKLGLAIYFAAWFSNKEKGRFFAFLLLLAAVLFLIMLQPDMGTAVIILTQALVIYFLSGASIIHFFALIPVALVSGILLILIEPYRFQRLKSFLDSAGSPERTSYHVKQILIALGTGGLMGVGLGNSLQKYAYLPENATDSIFAIIAEEFGFLGSIIVVCFYIIIVWRGFLIASQAKDVFGKLLAGGITSFFAIQTLINLGAQTALLPLTGVPLPLISYGGSSLIVILSAMGILLNVAKHTYK